MANKSLIIIFGIIGLVSAVAYIADLQQHPDTTLGTVMDNYDGTVQTGNNDNFIIPVAPTNTTDDTLTGSLFNFAFDIPIIGGLFKAIAWFINIVWLLLGSIWSWLDSITALYSILPIWMSVIITALIIWVITLAYQTYIPGK